MVNEGDSLFLADRRRNEKVESGPRGGLISGANSSGSSKVLSSTGARVIGSTQRSRSPGASPPSSPS